MRQQLGYKKTFYAVGRACIWAGKLFYLPRHTSLQFIYKRRKTFSSRPKILLKIGVLSKFKAQFKSIARQK